MKQKEINRLLAEHNIDFKPTDKTFYCNFLEYSPPPQYDVNDVYSVEVYKGGVTYYFDGFYMIMFWYRYYSCKRHNLTTRPDNGEVIINCSYFSRLPAFYRNTSQKKGLTIMKMAIKNYLQQCGRFPRGYSEEELDKICYIK